MGSPLSILIVVGARPQFVKAAAMVRAAERLAASKVGAERLAAPRIELIHTGQHYDEGMSRVFFEQMELPEPVVNLGISELTHGAMTGRMLEGLESEFAERRPDVVLVVGDTNSTLAAALAAAKLRLPIGHVEAGLRSFDRAMPEEINRVAVDHVSDFLFCPSQAAEDQLASEGIVKNVWTVGDVMYDATLYYREKAARPDRERPFALATIHREGNVDSPARLTRILRALARSPVPVALAAHPRTRAAIERLGLRDLGAVEVLDPLDYFSMLGHLEQCAFVVTDSGGLQKEAAYFEKKCVTLRAETEWTELVDLGLNRVAGTEPESILAAMEWATEPPGRFVLPYGDGHAAEKILDILNESLSPGAASS